MLLALQGTMQVPLVNMSATLEYPQCGKRAVVSYRAGIYRCLSCDFTRDLNYASDTDGKGEPGAFTFACVGFLIAFIFLL